MTYDGDLKLPSNFLVPPPEINGVSGEYLVKNGLHTFACSETQKFGHVRALTCFDFPISEWASFRVQGWVLLDMPHWKCTRPVVMLPSFCTTM